MKSRVLPLLRQKAVSPTPMRVLVLEQFFEQSTAKNLSDLENALPYADRSTIYRTLKTFVEKGLLHTLEDGSGALRYALCSEHCDEEAHQDFHPHFRCTQCAQTVCLEKVVLPVIKFPEGYQVEGMELMAKGICPFCSEHTSIP